MTNKDFKSALSEKNDTMAEAEQAVLHNFSSDASLPATAPQSLDSKVTEYIRSFGFSPHLKGYRYTRTALKIMIEEPEIFDDKITVLYRLVAKRHSKENATSSRVERAIRHSLEVAYSNMPKAFDIFMHDKKAPTNSEFLYLALDELTKYKM